MESGNMDNPGLTAYLFSDTSLEMPVVRASARREWMNANDGNAYRCLPMTMANQNGWLLLNPVAFVAEWDGNIEGRGITFEYDEPIEEHQQYLQSIFSIGVLTWTIPYLFRTSPGYNLMVRGPANHPKDGIQPLEGLVETEWAEAPFTMNWKFTRAHHPVRFEKGEPFCMITPIRRGEVETVQPNLQPITTNKELHQSLLYWFKRRRQTGMKNRFNEMYDKDAPNHYELDYMRGKSSDGQVEFAEHQTRLNLKPFKPEW